MADKQDILADIQDILEDIPLKDKVPDMPDRCHAGAAATIW